MNSENEKMASQAFELCQNAYEEGNYELAQTYILNAITHHSALKYLQTYPEILKKLPRSSRNTHVEQAINLYSIALFNNPPNDVIDIMKLIDDINRLTVAEKDLEPNETEDEDSKEAFVEEILLKLNKYSWEDIKACGKLEDLKTLSERIDLFNSFLQISDSVIADCFPKQHRQAIAAAPDQIQETKTFIEYIGIRSSVENYLNEVTVEVKRDFYNSHYITARLQQAETLLSQLWLFSVESIIGKDFFAQLDDLKKKCNDLEKEFLERESNPICKKIKDEIKQELSAKYSSNCKYTTIIEDMQKKYTEISQKINQIPLNTKIPEMQRELQVFADKIGEILKKRYAAYQSKCAQICRDAIQIFEDTTWVWESDAEEILRKCPIDTINEALICPETATILQMTKQILEDKLSRIKKADFAVKCIEAPKMKLEDF